MTGWSVWEPTDRRLTDPDPARATSRATTPASGAPGRSPLLGNGAALVLPLAVTLLTLRSFLSPGGFVLQVDAVFGPRANASNGSFFIPVSLTLQALHAAVGGELSGRIAVAACMFLCGFGPMWLLRRRPWWAQCAAGLLGMLNPWTFDRVVEGQAPVAAAGGALFLWLSAYESLQRRPSLRRAVVLALTTVLPIALSANFAGIVAVLAVAAAITSKPWRDRQRLRWTAIAAGLAALALLYGVLPFFLSHGPGTYSAVQAYGRIDWEAFRPTADGRYGTLPALAGFYGEWAERTGRIPVATSGNPWWVVSTLALVALTVAGAIASPARRWLLAIGLVGIALSAATATSWGLDAAVWLSDRIPLLAAYRDTQKWLALWLLAVVVLGAEVASTGWPWTRRPWVGPAAAVAMALATLLPAGVNTLRETPRLTAPAAYPADWYAAAAVLQANVAADTPVAILPWHLYEPLAFVGRLVSNPAPVFFPGSPITSNDAELPGEPAPPPSPGNIGQLAVAPEPRPCALADALRSIGARWVVVEQTVGADDVLRRLRPCGFEVVEGGPGRTSVLHG